MSKMFKKYMHVERLSGAYNPEINGLLNGTVYVFPKLDGANHSVFWDEEKGMVRCASRNQILSEGNDSTGFYKYFMAHPELTKFIEDHKNCIMYGEFMTPHTIKTYKDEVWNNYYVFDVVKYDGEQLRYMEVSDYHFLCHEYGINCIAPIAIIDNPTIDDLSAEMEHNNYLMKDREIGEGIVVKNYGFVNHYGRTTWGKMVREEFKAASKNPGKGFSPEEIMAHENVSKEFVAKEFNKFTTDRGETWSDCMIPDFLKYIWHEWWVDYSFELVAQSRNPVDINGLRRETSKLFVKYAKQVS